MIMKTQFTKLALMATLGLAFIFTISCGEHGWEEIFGFDSSSGEGEDYYSSSSIEKSHNSSSSSEQVNISSSSSKTSSSSNVQDVNSGYGMRLIGFDVDKTTVAQNEGFTVKPALRTINSNGTFPGGQVGVVLVDDNGDIVALLGMNNYREQNPSLSPSAVGNILSVVPRNVAAGQYQLRIVIRPEGGEWEFITYSTGGTPTSKDFVVRQSNISSSSVTEEQKINIIKSRYKSIQTSFSGGYFITVPTTTPSYTAGKVKDEVLQAGVDAVNLVRYIADIPDDVELDAEYTDLCQHGVVVLTAVDELTHTPLKPADMEPAFFDKGYQGTSHSNLALSTSNNLPSRTVFLYMDDSNAGNIDRVGHRRWVLNPTMKKTGFGVATTKYGAMYSTDKSRGNVDYDYVAWPSPGAFPTNLFGYNIAWNISVNILKYGSPDINKIKVTLEHTNSGKVWTFSNSTPSSTSTGKAYFNVDKGGYGISNSIIFRPELESSFKYKDGDVFKVTVSGLEKDLSYTVKMFDMDN
jgi:hypothetical protein